MMIFDKEYLLGQRLQKEEGKVKDIFFFFRKDSMGPECDPKESALYPICEESLTVFERNYVMRSIFLEENSRAIRYPGLEMKEKITRPLKSHCKSPDEKEWESEPWRSGSRNRNGETGGRWLGTKLARLAKKGLWGN